jgi:hypothetical protein
VRTGFPFKLTKEVCVYIICLELLVFIILWPVALLGDEDEEVVPEEEKLTFLARAELGVRFSLP